MLIVIITRADHPDMSPEVFGPFADESSRETWVDDMISTWPGVVFIQARMTIPPAPGL